MTDHNDGGFAGAYPCVSVDVSDGERHRAAGAAKPTPYYEDGAVTIYHADCMDVLPALIDVDLVVTSPPYNMGLVPGGNGRGMYRPGASSKARRFRDGYENHADAMDQREYDEWQRSVLAACWATLADRGAIFYNHRPRSEHGLVRLPLGLDFGLPLAQVITWDRGTGIDVNLRRFCSAYEWIFLFAKPDFRLVDHAASGRSDMWRLGMERESAHPAPFPLSLPARAIASTSPALVVDPFMGSGTTLRAAKDAGVRAIGIDSSERYCEMAVRRMGQEVLSFPADPLDGVHAGPSTTETPGGASRPHQPENHA